MEEQTKDLNSEIQNLERIAAFRLQMLLAQVKQDFIQGSVKENNRVFFNTLKELSGGHILCGPPINDDEKRRIGTLRAAFDGIMLKIALDETNKRKGEEDGSGKTTE